jgi:hypothetical protein
MKTTNIKAYCEQLQEGLRSELEVVGQENYEAISKISKCLNALSNTINKLKEFVRTYTFTSATEEIHFFKETKPVLLSQYYYYEILFAIKINEPFTGTEALRGHYHEHLTDLQQFVSKHAEFYKYCLSNSNELDDKYFVRSQSPHINPDFDSNFSTGYDNTLARIMSTQLAKEHLISLIRNLDTENGNRNSPSQLKWTGTKSALIELIYALQSVDSVNSGKADIKRIADSFENLFNISLGNYYRHFQEIRLRKSGRATFLDLMKEKFVQRLNEMDER